MAFKPLPEDNIAPTVALAKSTELRDWMIKTNDYLKGANTQTNYPNAPGLHGELTSQELVWQKGRELPF
jgi:hypothetical protein